MGCIFSGIGAFVASFAGSACCQLFTACIPSSGGAVYTRLVYAGYLTIIVILQSISMIPGLEKYLSKIPRLCLINSSNSTAGHELCLQMSGYLISYKLCFGYIMFCLLMGLITIGVKRTSSIQAVFHNRLAGIKMLMLIGLIVASFAIPTTIPFLNTIRVFGMAGGLFFIMIQLICVVDFAHSMNEAWLDRIESGNRKWIVVQLMVMLLSFAVALVAYSLTLVYYGHTRTHIALVIVNIIVCLLASVVSILPAVREYQPSSGLLQSSLVSVYVSYLTWTAVSSDPNSPGLNRSWVISSDFMLATTLILFILSLLYFIFTNKFGIRVGGEDPSSKVETDGAAEEGQDSPVAYSYSMLHFLLATSALYATMTLTSWLKPSSDLHSFIRNEGAFWVKATSSWACMLVYIWTCVAPVIFPDREFA